MEYLIRLIQIHETFRKPELEALADLANLKMEILFYSAQVRDFLSNENNAQDDLSDFLTSLCFLSSTHDNLLLCSQNLTSFAIGSKLTTTKVAVLHSPP